MAQFDGLTDFVKSGARRLRDAEELLEPPTLLPNESGATSRHCRGAMYLAGYGIECLLKAYLIRETNQTNLSAAQAVLNKQRADAGLEPLRDIGGIAGHSLVYLLSLTSLPSTMSEARKQQFGICSKWRSAWRYDPTPAAVEEAEEFVQTARRIVDWLTPQI